MSKKVFKLGWLNVGDKFSFINLNNYRNLYIKRVSDSGCIIGGDVRNYQDDPWRTIQGGYSVSNSAEVYLLEN